MLLKYDLEIVGHEGRSIDDALASIEQKFREHRGRCEALLLIKNPEEPAPAVKLFVNGSLVDAPCSVFTNSCGTELTVRGAGDLGIEQGSEVSVCVFFGKKSYGGKARVATTIPSAGIYVLASYDFREIA